MPRARAVWRVLPALFLVGLATSAEEPRESLSAGLAALRAGHYGVATRHFRNALEVSPGCLDCRLGLARAECSRLDHEEALEALVVRAGDQEAERLLSFERGLVYLAMAKSPSTEQLRRANASPLGREAAWAAERQKRLKLAAGAFQAALEGGGPPAAELALIEALWQLRRDEAARDRWRALPSELRAQPRAREWEHCLNGSPLSPAETTAAPRALAAPAPDLRPFQLGEDPQVRLEGVVGRDGRLHCARVLGGPPLVDLASLVAVQRWRFEPARLDGELVATYHELSIRDMRRD